MSTKGDFFKNMTEGEKVAYLSIVASMAAADGQLDETEFEQLRTSCLKLKMTAIGVEAVLMAATMPESIQFHRYFDKLKDSDMRFGLLADLYIMAYADQVVTPEEEQESERVAALLNISSLQVALIKRFAHFVWDSRKGAAHEPGMVLEPPMVTEMAAAGISMGALAIAGGGLVGEQDYIADSLRRSISSIKGFGWLLKKV